MCLARLSSSLSGECSVTLIQEEELGERVTRGNGVNENGCLGGGPVHVASFVSA